MGLIRQNGAYNVLAISLAPVIQASPRLIFQNLERANVARAWVPSANMAQTSSKEQRNMKNEWAQNVKWMKVKMEDTEIDRHVRGKTNTSDKNKHVLMKDKHVR